MKNQRQLRVGEAVRHALASIFQRGEVPWPKDFDAPIVTITEVSVSPDLRNAKAYFLAMNGAGRQDTAKVLDDLTGFFRHQLATSVKMRYVPNLQFKGDTSLENASKIETLLSKPAVARDLETEEEVE